MFHFVDDETYERLEHATLAEIYAYAEEIGFTADDVEIDVFENLDGEKSYYVEIGHMYGDYWSWSFDDLDGRAIDFDFTGVGDYD